MKLWWIFQNKQNRSDETDGEGSGQQGDAEGAGDAGGDA